MGIGRGDIVAFVGAGGKSSAILQAAGELGEAGVPVLVVPTTKMFVSEADRIGLVLTSDNGDGLRSKVTEALVERGERALHRVDREPLHLTEADRESPV